MKRRLAWIGLVPVLAAVACGPSEEVQQQLTQLQAVSAEKDSLLQIVVENTRLMSDISAELAKVTPGGERLATAGESPYQMSRDSLLATVQSVTERVQAAEERLERSQRRIRSLNYVSDSLRVQLDQFETMLADIRATIENQKEAIVSLNDRIERMRIENLALADAKAAVEDSLRLAETEANTAYYVIGTKDELKEQGIIVEEGGSRFPLIFRKVGTTLVPANDLDPALFQSIDIRELAEIPLPEENRVYRIVSAQDLTALDQPTPDGTVQNTIRIANPHEFWQGSRFLIVVRG